MTHVWRLVRMLPSYRARVLAIFATSALVGIIGMATPFLIRQVVDTLSHGRSGAWAPEIVTHRLVLALGLFMAFRLLLVVLGAVQHHQSAALWLDNVGSLRQRVFDDMSTLSLRYYESAHVGDIMDRFAAIVPVTIWIRDLVEGTLAAILQLVFSLIVLLFVAPAAGLVMLVAVPVNIYISWASLRATKPHRKRWQRLGGRMSAILSEMMSQITTVRAFGGEDVVRARFGDAHRSWRAARVDEWRIDRTWTTILLAVNGAALSAVALIVVTAAMAGRYSLGDVLLVLTLSQALILLVQPIARAITSAGEAEAAAERLVELLDITPGVAESPDAIALDAIRSIAFEDVSFTYPGQDTPVLKRVSFAVGAGNSLALVGPSGSGKSSLVKLLLRLHEPTEGRILINGRDIRDFSQSSLRARIGIVLQDVALFNDTIRRNIAFAQEDASPDQIARAARMAHADDFILRMPEGYDTDVGERGVKLSGGQRQRISVARAILRDPDLVILDEATSALDSESETLVQAGLELLMRDRTSIIIAHRLSTVRDATTIAVLQSGEIVERGSHDTLLRARGAYRQLHDRQVGSTSIDNRMQLQASL